MLEEKPTVFLKAINISHDELYSRSLLITFPYAKYIQLGNYINIMRVETMRRQKS